VEEQRQRDKKEEAKRATQGQADEGEQGLDPKGARQDRDGKRTGDHSGEERIKDDQE